MDSSRRTSQLRSPQLRTPPDKFVAGSASTQQIDDLRLKLRFVFCPIAVYFPGAPAQAATVCHAPGMERVMCSDERDVATYVRSHGNFTSGCLCTGYFSFAFKRPSDLNAEVNFHCRFTLCSMMVEETIVPVGSQTLMAM